jgi:hypothetical protein
VLRTKETTDKQLNMSTEGAHDTTTEHRVEEVARRILAIINRTEDRATVEARAPRADSRAVEVARRLLAVIDDNAFKTPTAGPSAPRGDDDLHDTDRPAVAAPSEHSARDDETVAVDKVPLTSEPPTITSDSPRECIADSNAAEPSTNLILSGVTAKAALQGRLEVLKWLHDTVCSLPAEHVYGPAARQGHLDVLKWARASGLGPFDNRKVLRNAIDGRHTHILRWLHDEEALSWETIWACVVARADFETIMEIRKEQGVWDASMPVAAAAHGRPEIAMWAIEHGCPWDDRLCIVAARGNLALLEWLAARGNVCKVPAIDYAAHDGRLEIVKWLRARGCPFGPMTCDMAAKNGHLEVLKWLHENGCPWGESTCREAAAHHQYATLGWAIAHGCPFDKHIVRHVARRAVA